MARTSGARTGHAKEQEQEQEQEHQERQEPAAKAQDVQQTEQGNVSDVRGEGRG